MLILKVFNVLKLGLKRGAVASKTALKCNSKLCMQLRIACIALVSIVGLLWFNQWRWEKSLSEAYTKGYAEGKAAEQLSSEKALAALQAAYDANVQVIEGKYLKELERINEQKSKENQRVMHWQTYSGVGGGSHECLNAQQLQELRESADSTR